MKEMEMVSRNPSPTAKTSRKSRFRLNLIVNQLHFHSFHRRHNGNCLVQNSGDGDGDGEGEGDGDGDGDGGD